MIIFMTMNRRLASTMMKTNTKQQLFILQQQQQQQQRRSVSILSSKLPQLLSGRSSRQQEKKKSYYSRLSSKQQQRYYRLFSSSSPSSSNESFSDTDDEEPEHNYASSYDIYNPTDEHSALRGMLRTFVQNEVEEQAEYYNAHEIFNHDLFRKLGSNDGLGILGLTAPTAVGGTGFVDATAVCIAHEELSYSDPAFCLSYLAHSLLFINNLTMNATTRQQQLFLPKACSGEHIGGMCMSEPNAGTDVLGMQTTAKPTEDGSGTWIINGTKMWITNGTLVDDSEGVQRTGDVFLVYAKTGPNRQDITQFIVTKNMNGFTVGQKINGKLGMRASNTAELVFNNVHVPSSNIVGTVNGATICMMRNLEIERIGLAAMSVGIARRCLDVMKSYCIERTTFGKNIAEYGQIQQMITQSYAEYMAGKAYLYTTANTLDITSAGNTLNADGCKLYCTQMAKTVADRAIQVLGGYGYVSEYVVERLWRDSKLLEIGGGTNESHHKNMMRDIVKNYSKSNTNFE